MVNTVVVVVGLSVLALLLLAGMLAKMFRKAGPNEALIVYGFRGPRVVKGHGTVIFPMIENCRELSFELISMRTKW
jgi:flotillin